MSDDDIDVTPDAPEVGEQPEEEKKKKRRVLPLLLAIVLICGGLGGIGYGVYAFWPKSAPTGIVDMEGNIVVPDDPDATSSAFLEAADMVTDIGGEGFIIASVGLNVPLGSVNDVYGVMDPPNFTSAFLIRNRGVGLDNASQGTVYIIAHSTRFGTAPGNLLQSNEHSLVKEGDMIQVNGLNYRVTGWQTSPQDQLGNVQELWANTPGMLVFITCVLRNDREAPTDNLIITGQLVS